MTIESILGITASLITIGGVLVAGPKLIRKPSLTTLMNQLADKKLSSENHRRILRKMKRRMGGSKIKDEYIKKFVLNDRGKEAVFMDLCVKNDIEPTKDVCLRFLGADSRKAREYYNAKRNQSDSSNITIITSDESRFTPTSSKKTVQIVYMSELMMSKHPDTCKNLIKILEKYNVNYSFIKGTKDIWCRDYMPIQIESGKLIQFKYDPSYLKGEEWDSIRSNVKEIRENNDWFEKYNIEESEINLDGGNVLICEGRAIISDRIFEENGIVRKGNPNYEVEKKSLINDLSKLLDCEIIIIPALKSKEEDMTGHADGMVRFVNRDTIIGNERKTNEYSYMKEGLQKAIDKYNLTYIDIPYFEDKDCKNPLSAVGFYVNYLEVDNLIVMPVFGKDEDLLAKETIQKAFPSRQIEAINYTDVAKEGGLLNCTTWVVRSTK